MHNLCVCTHACVLSGPGATGKPVRLVENNSGKLIKGLSMYIHTKKARRGKQFPCLIRRLIFPRRETVAFSSRPPYLSWFNVISVILVNLIRHYRHVITICFLKSVMRVSVMVSNVKPWGALKPPAEYMAGLAGCCSEEMSYVFDRQWQGHLRSPQGASTVTVTPVTPNSHQKQYKYSNGAGLQSLIHHWARGLHPLTAPPAEDRRELQCQFHCTQGCNVEDALFSTLSVPEISANRVKNDL